MSAMLGNSEAIEAALATEGEVAAELPAEAAAMGDEAVLEPPPEVGELPPDEAMPAEVPTVDDVVVAVEADAGSAAADGEASAAAAAGHAACAGCQVSAAS